MNNAAFARAGEQVRDNITEIAEKARMDAVTYHLETGKSAGHFIHG